MDLPVYCRENTYAATNPLLSDGDRTRVVLCEPLHGEFSEGMGIEGMEQ
jgi:hypothetical protein